VQSRGGEIEAAYGPALDPMSGLGELRSQIDAFDGTRGLENIEVTSETFDAYAPFMIPIFEANKQVALAIDDPELRRGAELVDLSSRQTDLIAQLTRDLLLATIGGDSRLNQPAEISAVAGRLGQLRTNEQLITTKATGGYRPLAEALFGAEEIQRFPEVVDQALETGEPDIDGVIRYSAGEDPETYGYTIFRGGVTEALSAKADDLESAAEARQRWYLVLAALALGAAITVTWLVSRSITRPLRSLTGQATAMADHRLPEAVLDILDTPLGEDVEVPGVEPVAVRTSDEVSDVAEALNTVQDTALDLAVEQAVLRRNIADSFVNLGRRNQNLLGRQLDFITELETNETDPDTLSNLFRLDHLATRMRRNAESLLVLAGIEPPRKWAAPVRLTDVIRAALGEVEDYQRVTVRGVEPATIVGAAAADLAHLLAELIENALVFSPPDQTVDIRGRSRPEGYTLAMIDSGMGMDPADIEAANRRLAGAESFTIAPSKYLGHYVAGNLAARHDIGVRLDNSPGNGVTATVNVPPGLLTTEAVTSAPVTPPHGVRAPAGSAPARAGVLGAAEPAGLGAGPNGMADPAAVEGSAPWRAPGEHQPVTTSSWPAPASLSAGAPLPGSAVSRTQSGLVKRAPRGGNGAGPPDAAVGPAGPGASSGASAPGAQPGPAPGAVPGLAPGSGPADDLLDALSRHTANLQGFPERTGYRPSSTASTARGPQAPPGPPTPPGPPARQPTSGVYDPTGRHDRPSRGASRPRPPSGDPGPLSGERPAARWGDVNGGPLPPRPSARAPGGPTGPVPPPPSVPPAGPSVPAPPLTRRVRGAQMPTTSPLSLRRSTGEHPVTPPPPPAAPVPPSAATPPATSPADAPEPTRSADDVYGFLTSFTAGIQRGLDETRRPDHPGDGDGNR
jgi:signal transduction histidine kinase